MLTMASVLLSAVHFLAFDQYRFPEFLSYAALLVAPTWVWLSRQMREQKRPVDSLFWRVCKRGLWCIFLLGVVAMVNDGDKASRLLELLVVGLLTETFMVLFFVGTLVLIFGIALSIIASVYGWDNKVERIEARARRLLGCAIGITLLAFEGAVGAQQWPVGSWSRYGYPAPSFHTLWWYYPIFLASISVAVWDFGLRRGASRGLAELANRCVEEAEEPLNVPAQRHQEQPELPAVAALYCESPHLATLTKIVVLLLAAPIVSYLIFLLYCAGGAGSLLIILLPFLAISPFFLVFRAVVESRKYSSALRAIRGVNLCTGKYLSEASGDLSEEETDRHFRANTRRIELSIGDDQNAEIDADRSFAEPSTETWIAFAASPRGKRAIAHWSPGNDEWLAIEPYRWERPFTLRGSAK